MNTRSMIVIALLVPGLLVAESSVYQVRIPLNASCKNLLVKISNNNDNIIIQNNTMSTPIYVPAVQQNIVTSPTWFDTAWRYKEIVGAGIFFVAYGALYAHLVRKATLVKRGDAWANWHEEVPLDALRMMDSVVLQQELCTRIKEYYQAQAVRTHDNAEQLFLQDVEAELAQMQDYITQYNWFMWSNAAYLFPKQEHMYKKAQVNSERLHFLKSLVTSACVQQQAA